MKTLLLSFLFAASLQALSAQNEIAFVEGVIPLDPAPKTTNVAAAEPALSAFSHTVDDVAIISLGKGFRHAVNLQVLTPSTEVLVNQKIPAGQTRVKIDLAGMENGTYTLRIKLGNRTWVKQVVKD